MRRAATNISLLVTAFLVVHCDAAAQTRVRRVEIAVIGSVIRFVEFDPDHERVRRRCIPNSPCSRQPTPTWLDPGFGVRFTYHLNDRLGFEAEASDFIRDAFFLRGGSDDDFDGVLRGGEKAQYSGGVRIGRRYKKMGVFAKIRSGVIVFEGLPRVFDEVSDGNATLVGKGEIPAVRPMLDVGGIAELRVSPRAALRVDVGDTLWWFWAEPKELNPSFTRHNLQVTGSFGFRF